MAICLEKYSTHSYQKLNSEEIMNNSIKLRQVDRLTAAATLMGETRGEPYLGKVAVAWVIRNRMDAPKWWGVFSSLDRRLTGIDPPRYSAEAVCRKLYQFSCWNRNDPSWPICVKFSDPAQFENNILNAQFSDCLKAVDAVFAGKAEDITKGATHYYNPKVVNPKWDDDGEMTAIVGNHRFYKGIK